MNDDIEYQIWLKLILQIGIFKARGMSNKNIAYVRKVFQAVLDEEDIKIRLIFKKIINYIKE